MITAVPRSDTRVNVVDLSTDWVALRSTWDEYVEAHPRGSIFHASDMVSVYQATKCYKPLALAAVSEHGEILALIVATRVQSLPNPFGRISSRSIWYAEPLCNDDEQGINALAQLIAEHDRKMRSNTLFTEIRPLFAPGPERIALERSGYNFLDYLNYIVDVEPEPEAIWRSMRRDARRSIQKSERAGFTTCVFDSSDCIKTLYAYLQISYEHVGVPLVDISLFEAAFKYLQPKNRLRVSAVMEDGHILTMQATLKFKDLAFDWYRGAERRPGFAPSDLAVWREYVWAHEQGCTRYDMGGAGWPDEDYGVRDYKAKFGGELVCYGRYRKVYSTWKLALAERAYNLRRRVQSKS